VQSSTEHLYRLFVEDCFLNLSSYFSPFIFYDLR